MVDTARATPRTPAAPWALPGLVLRGMRPRQWPKNGLVLAGLVFARQFVHPDQVLRAFLAVLLFCLISGAVYLINDLLDIEKDRLHPTKRRRPLASGQLPVPVAIVAAALAAVGGTVAAFVLSPAFAAVILGYLVLQAVYVTVLKHTVILDVMALASGFVLRAIGGAIVLNVPISPWLYVCTMLFALFISLGKRRQELLMLEGGAGGHRPALAQYSVAMLDQLVQVTGTSLLVSYILYTVFAENLPRNHSMMLTIPFVLYGLFRYTYLVYVRGEGGSPEEILLRDRPSALCVALWGATAIIILYLTPRA